MGKKLGVLAATIVPALVRPLRYLLDAARSRATKPSISEGPTIRTVGVR
jgi:hypothetical protein